jgi:murein DD-endopeptidase MepM/ murein hydrolase activator NlpD
MHWKSNKRERMTQYLDPTLLGIVPPMDLGLGAQEGISPFPLKLRTHDNSQPTVGSVGLFGARRNVAAPGLIRTHEGVDLLAGTGTPVFSVQHGKVLSVGTTSVSIGHTRGFRYLTFYQHLQNIVVSTNQNVVQGERIAEVGTFTALDTHLHFEIRYPFDRATSDYVNSLPIDPTWALFEWEKKRYRNNNDTRNVVRADSISELNEIVRGRLLRFLRVQVQQFNRNIYYPLGSLNDEERSLVETLRSAFFQRRRVELVWRECLFFNQIEFVFNEDDKIPILAEVRVMGK